MIVKSSQKFVWSSTVNTTVTWTLDEVPCLSWSQLHCRPRDCCWLCGGRGWGPGPTSRTRNPGPEAGDQRARGHHPAVPSHAPSSQQSASHDHLQSVSITLLFVFRHELASLISDAWELWKNTQDYWSSKSKCGANSKSNQLQIKCPKLKSDGWPLGCNWKVSGSQADLSATAN